MSDLQPPALVISTHCSPHLCKSGSRGFRLMSTLSKRAVAYAAAAASSSAGAHSCRFTLQTEKWSSWSLTSLVSDDSRGLTLLSLNWLEAARCRSSMTEQPASSFRTWTQRPLLSVPLTCCCYSLEFRRLKVIISASSSKLHLLLIIYFTRLHQG